MWRPFVDGTRPSSYLPSSASCAPVRMRAACVLVLPTRATHTRIEQLAFMEARHRAHARVEDRIKAAKDSGLGRLPSRKYAINQAWVQLAAVAADLIAWLQLLALDGDPKSWPTSTPTASATAAPKPST